MLPAATAMQGTGRLGQVRQGLCRLKAKAKTKARFRKGVLQNPDPPNTVRHQQMRTWTVHTSNMVTDITETTVADNGMLGMIDVLAVKQQPLTTSSVVEMSEIFGEIVMFEIAVPVGHQTITIITTIRTDIIAGVDYLAQYAVSLGLFVCCYGNARYG